MISRITLLLFVSAGCAESPHGDISSDTAHTTGTGHATSSSDPSPGTSDTDGAPVTDSSWTGGVEASDSRSTDESGGHSDSHSASGHGQETGQSGSSDTGDTSTTSDTSTTGDTSTTDESRTTGDGSTTDTGTSTTGECLALPGPAPVELGSADDLGAPGAYVLLAKAAITNVPGSAVAGGNVGISPAAATAMTGLALVLDPSGVYSTSPAVVAPWKVYAADYTIPTPPLLTTAVLGMQAAYTDAAGRVPTDYLNLAAGNLGGLTLAPGVYTWGSTVLIPDDVTLDGSPDDVWIFQISNDLDVSTGKSVVLAGGAQASNVFWQIAGQATIHVGAHLEGVILSKTGITFQTDATLTGRAFAQTMIALDMNAITAP